MTASVPPASQNISESVAKLRQLCRVDVQSGWKYMDCDSALNSVNICNWQVAELNDKGHIAWPAGKQVLYLGQQLLIPDNLHGYPVTDLRLRLGLTWWAEDARIFVNGELVGQGDLFDSSDRVLLTDSAVAGEGFLVVLRLVSPGHDAGALVRSVCLYEAADPACIDPAFVADELEILQNSLIYNLQTFKLAHYCKEIIADNSPLVKREILQSEVFRQVELIDWSAVSDRQKFDRSLAVLRQNLLGYLRGFSGDLEEGTAESTERTERGENYWAFGMKEAGEKLSTSIYIGEGGEKLSKFRGLKLPPDNLAVNCQLSTVNCLSTSIYIGKIYLLGHAHLDLAWLWPIEETWSAAERTFESVLKLQAEFPELIFCHSTPALYAWIEEHRPDLFAAIKKQVAAGRWEVVGGMWVEPDLNLISAESMVRQVFYGQRYAQEKFGELMRVVWLPDTFGFGWQLPQILREGGIDYFVTQKLRWNDTTEFPHGVFWWEGLDGTKIFSMMSAAIGEGIESVKMANYTFDWEVKTGLQAALWLPGVGDHGGGPTRDMLEVAQRWQNSPFFPSLHFAKAVDYLSAIESQFLPEISDLDSQATVSTLPSLPIWKDELYLEFHRGCYTTRADQKRQNRRCEELLYQAELLSSLAAICAGTIYPASELETAWKKVLFNQFHDILPGSAIARVYTDANLAFAEVDRTCNQIVAQSLLSIAERISLPSPPQPDARPILIFNTLNWSRSEVVAVPLPDSAPETWQICDLSRQRLPSQISQVDRTQPQFTLLFWAIDIPAIGYKLFWLYRAEAETPENPSPVRKNFIQAQLAEVTNNVAPKMATCQETHFDTPRNVLENIFFRATIDIETGNLSSIWDKTNHREILNAVGGNQLQAFEDSGQYWDAWNIDPNYQKYQLPPPILKDIYWVEKGELRQSLRVIRKIGKSEFCQDYIVEINSPLLKIKTVADWQETHVLVKTAFGLNQSADFATCEIPGGAIERSTKPQTAAETAKWEVPILRWADISNNDFGVSLLNDCKYGCDLQPNQLRLTLLRGSTWPDAQADTGIHEFTYAVYPHSGNWQNAGTVRRGYELNVPVLVKVLPELEQNSDRMLPAVGKLLDLSAKNLVLMAFKQSDENPNVWILRCYESHGEEAKLELNSDLDLTITQAVDLLEKPVTFPEKSDDGKIFKISPWKIATFAVNL